MNRGPELTFSLRELSFSLLLLLLPAVAAAAASAAAAAAVRSEIFGVRKATHVGSQDADAKNSEIAERSRQRMSVRLPLLLFLSLCHSLGSLLSLLL